MKNSYTVFGLLIYSAIMVFVIGCGGDKDDASFINAYPPDNSTIDAEQVITVSFDNTPVSLNVELQGQQSKSILWELDGRKLTLQGYPKFSSGRNHIIIISWTTGRKILNYTVPPDDGVSNRTPTTDPSEPIVDATAELIDFEAEKSEIQQVYSAFYSAFNSRKLLDIRRIWKEHPDHAQFRVAWVAGGFVEPVGPTAGWRQIESTIEGLWTAQGTRGQNWTGSNRFSQFWIRRSKFDPNTLEASARASASYRSQGSGITYAYLIKNEHEDWQLQQIDSVTGHVVNMGHGDPEISKYFTDESAKVP